MRWLSSTLLVSAGLFFAGSLNGCSKSAATAPAAEAAVQAGGTAAPAVAQATPANTASDAPAAKQPDPVVVLHTTHGDIAIKLFQEKAPRTVDNFLREYAERGFYDGTIVHHVEPGMMLIAGGYTAGLERKPTRTPIYNESHNGLTNRRGTVAMIRQPDLPHSATSEFFINLADNPDFDFKTDEGENVPGYCVFGEVVQGMEIVERIAQLPTSSQGDFARVPSPEVAIRSVSRLH